jgi:hypothetical protein
MDEQMIQQAAMDQMLGMGGGAPAGGMGGDPFAMEAPTGYTMVYVPDEVLPAVMELVSQADMAGSALGASDASPVSAMIGGTPLV